MAPKVEAKETQQPTKDGGDSSAAETKGEVVELPVELQAWDDWDYFYKSTKEEKEFWRKFTPHELGIIFTRGPIPLLHRAWGKLDRGDAQSLVDANSEEGTLTYWDPFILKDRGKRLYHSYSPVILETRPTPGEATEELPCPGLEERKRVLAFYPPLHNRKQRPGCWFAMPSLSFLPPGFTRVIAGDGGLLVCDGAMQWTAVLVDGELSPFSARPPIVQGGRPLPMEPDAWTKDSNSPGQSILLVCNPVTRELLYLPPFHRTMSLNAKAAVIRYMDFAELVPRLPTPPAEGEKLEGDDVDGHDVKGAVDSIEKIVRRASRRGTLIEKKLEKRMSVPFAQPAIRRESVHMDLDDELDELDFEEEMRTRRRPSRRRSSQRASDDVHMPGEVDKVIEGRFQRFHRLYFECFGRTPVPVPPPSRHYVVVVMGYNEEVQFDGDKKNTLVCAVYSSRMQDEWSYIRPMPCNARTMPIEHGRTGLALLTSLAHRNWMAACFGGLVLTDIDDATGVATLDRAQRSADTCSTTTTSSTTSTHGAKVEKKSYQPAIDRGCSGAVFFVSVVPEDDTALVYPFIPDGYEDEVLTCPIILQPFGASSPEIVVAVTRRVYGADRLIIFGVEFEHDVITEYPRPNSTFSWISESPPFLYQELFITPEVSNKPFECSAGNGLISFKATDGQRLAIYDMYTARWWIEDFHRYTPCKRKEKPFRLLEVCSWEPNFRQRVEYDWRYVGGKLNPINVEAPPDEAKPIEPAAKKK